MTGVLDKFEELLGRAGLRLRKCQRDVWSNVEGELPMGEVNKYWIDVAV